jgi:hypothetical protein
LRGQRRQLDRILSEHAVSFGEGEYAPCCP